MAVVPLDINKRAKHVSLPKNAMSFPAMREARTAGVGSHCGRKPRVGYPEQVAKLLRLREDINPNLVGGALGAATNCEVNVVTGSGGDLLNQHCVTIRSPGAFA